MKKIEGGIAPRRRASCAGCLHGQSFYPDARCSLHRHRKRSDEGQIHFPLYIELRSLLLGFVVWDNPDAHTHPLLTFVPLRQCLVGTVVHRQRFTNSAVPNPIVLCARSCEGCAPSRQVRCAFFPVVPETSLAGRSSRSRTARFNPLFPCTSFPPRASPPCSTRRRRSPAGGSGT